MESIEVPAVFTIPDSILNSLCAGRGTSLVIDLGGQGTTITPVVDGFELKKAKLFTSIGGNAIDQAISNYLYEQKIEINPFSSLFGKQPLPTASIFTSSASSFSRINYHPKYSYSTLLASSKISKSYLDLLYSDLMKDLKHWMSFIPHYSLAQEYRSEEGLQQVGVYLPPFYELPDGTQIPSSYRLCTLAENLFFPETHQQRNVSSNLSSVSTANPPSQTTQSNSASSSVGANTSLVLGKRARELMELDRQQQQLLFSNLNSSGSNNNSSSSSSSSLRIEEESLSDLAYLATSRADVDVRKDLLSNVILCGGTSLLTGLPQRLTKELQEMTPSNYKVKVISNLPVERQNSTWIGGSILSICGTFHQMWISRKEYEEFGAENLVRKRFYF